MPTDFFQRQDVARRSTKRLVILFVLAVIAVVVSIHLILGLTLGFLVPDTATAGPDWSRLADPQLLAISAIGTLVVVGGGSLFKIAQLTGGGRVVAEELGGRLLNPDTTVPSEQRVLNVVEEMAIASGTPTPPVYLLDEEPGINAFAAGFSPNDAVIGVTRGTAELLTRDELQGVMAHEFSHIFNGDMRLNIRLIGLLYGILVVGMLGHFVLRATMYSGLRRGRSRREGNPLPLIALGAGLMVIGFVGTFFGNIIKAAVSRQREFLADASAVQYTRLPEGIAGALKKIGAASMGSKLQSPNAPEASHMFFGRATSGLSGMFSTHPPLGERIRRIEPGWDGTFPAVQPLESLSPSHDAGPAVAASGAPAAAGVVSGLTVSPMALNIASAMEYVGQPTPAHLSHAARLIERLPAPLVRAAHEAFGARAVIYALLLDRHVDVRKRQLGHLSAAADPQVFEETLATVPLVVQLDVEMRLPLLEMTLPALRTLTPTQYERFKDNVSVLVSADEHIDLFEWSLQRILLHDLESRYGAVSPPRVRHHTVSRVRAACEILLSALAHAGRRDEHAVQRAFEQGWRHLQLPDARLQPPWNSGPDALDAALATLVEAAPQVKRAVLDAAVVCVSADRTVTAIEAELLRAIAGSLDCPMPPVLGRDSAL
jgi:Zn-dependent protease with chaperone function